MMHTDHNAEALHSNGAPSTTEELIVQYLDGELVRRELETVLFDRLAHSEEARTLLREYLVVRGAIRMSREDERFQLSDELDDRTRARVKQMMEALEPEAPVVTGFIGDKDAIATSAVTRRTNRWTKRIAYSSVGLLLLLGAWFAGQREGVHREAHTLANRSVPASEPQQASVLPIGPTTSSQPEQNPVVEKAHEVAHAQKVTRPVASPSPSGATASVQTPSTPSVTTPNQDDIMLSQRYAKAINSAKNEVVVSSRDRM